MIKNYSMKIIHYVETSIVRLLALLFLIPIQISHAFDYDNVANDPTVTKYGSSEQANQENPELPIEMWVKIMSYLDDLKTYRSVCLTDKKFNNNLAQEILTNICKKTIVCDLAKNSTLMMLDKLSQHAVNHKISLNLKIINFVSCSDLRKILSMNNMISELDLSNNNLSATRFDVVLENKDMLANLSKLKLSNCLLDTDNIKSLVASSPNGPVFSNLNELDLSHNKIGNTFAKFMPSSSSFPALKSLIIKDASLDKRGVAILDNFLQATKKRIAISR